MPWLFLRFRKEMSRSHAYSYRSGTLSVETPDMLTGDLQTQRHCCPSARRPSAGARKSGNIPSALWCILINVAAQFVKVLLCLLFPAVLRIPGPDPRGSRMPSNQESVVPLEERLRCDGNLSVSLCSVQRYQARHQLTGPACTQIWNSDQSGRIGPKMRAGSAQLRQRLRLTLHQAQGLLVPRHSPKSAVPIGNPLLGSTKPSRPKVAAGSFRRECGHVRRCGSFAAVISC